MNPTLDSLEVLNGSGHITLTWDPADPADVTKAREEVENLRNAGYSFFAVVGSTGADEVEAGDGTLIVERIKDPVQPAAPAAPVAPLPPPRLVPAPQGPKTACKGTSQVSGRPCTRKVAGDYCHDHDPDHKKARRGPVGGGRRNVAVRRMAGG